MKRFLVIALVAACNSDPATDSPDAAVDAAVPPDAYVDLSGPLFAPDHIVEVSITLAPADWDVLRVQSRTIGSVVEGNCLAQPAPSPFSTYHAAITIDGTTFPDVGLKKKGFFGSVDPTKPSLKVKLDEFVAGTEYLGLDKLTLNNSRQDPSLLRTCLSYQIFASAGIVVPRCNFAHVRVNGTDLGVYVNVENPDHRMTKKRYADGTGPFFEGTLSDLRRDWLGTFDAKGGGDARLELGPIANVLENSPDATLLADLAPYIDVDKYINFWATEILTNHWDGYANNRNNYFIYKDPTSGKIEFLPWGPDGALIKDATFGGLGATNGPVAITANGILAHRLYDLPATRQKLFDRQRQLLATIWNETALLGELDRMETLISPIADPVQGTAWHGAVIGVRQFVSGRRAQLTAALDAGPTWTEPLPTYPCLDVRAHVTGTFATTWGTLGAANPLATGSGTFALTINGVTTNLTPVGATSGLDPNPQPGQPANALVQVYGRRASDGHIFVVLLSIPPTRFFPRSGDLGFFDSFGLVFDYDPTTMMSTLVGYTLGTFTLTQAGMTNGAPVAGSFDANADQQGTPPP